MADYMNYESFSKIIESFSNCGDLSKIIRSLQQVDRALSEAYECIPAKGKYFFSSSYSSFNF